MPATVVVMLLRDRKRTSGHDSHQVNLVALLMDRLGMHIFPSNRNELPRILEVCTSVF
jgi:hypothetical protein